MYMIFKLENIMKNICAGILNTIFNLHMCNFFNIQMKVVTSIYSQIKTFKHTDD